jgi:hypothetical protein
MFGDTLRLAWRLRVRAAYRLPARIPAAAGTDPEYQRIPALGTGSTSAQPVLTEVP